MPWLLVSLTLCILATGITLITLHLRKVIHQQMLASYAEVIHAAYVANTEEVDEEFSDLPPETQQLLTILEASEARTGVVTVRLFDKRGRPNAKFGIVGRTNSLTIGELEQLVSMKPLAEYYANMNLSALLGEENSEDDPITYPLVRVLTPLRQKGKFSGAAEFIVDGDSMAVAMEATNKDLFQFAFLIFSIGGSVIAVSLLWAFSRLQRSNALLLQRTESLIRANHELTLSAKTSAVGAITAHLIHDLKSPLFGLQSFVASRANAGDADDEDWNVAIDTTRRMQKLIGDIVKILQEEKGSSKYEITIAEWSTMLENKIEPQARQAGLTFTVENRSDAILTNKDANILLLVATNILQNAVQATPRGGSLAVECYYEEETLLVDLQDTGPGLPPSILSTLFTPSRSTKSGGTGLGLAISKQLANHIGADLLLKQTSTAGTIFQLRVPERILVKSSELVLP